MAMSPYRWIVSFLLTPFLREPILPLNRPDRVDWDASLELRTVRVNDADLVYAVKGEGEPLVLIHGFGAGMWVWEKQIDVLSQFYRVYLLDLIGHGYSDRPKIDYNPETYVRCVSDFMETTGIDRATLIGNSMGGGIAWALAGRFPERVERLVLIDAVPPDVLDQLKNVSFRMLSAIIDIPLLSRMVFWGVRRGSVRRILDDCVFDLNCTTTEVVDRQCRISRIEGTSWVLYSTFKHAREAPRLEKYLSRISHRTLLIWGEEDRVFSPSVGETLRRRIPGSRLHIVKRSGHIPMWETPEEVNRVILDFLKAD